MNFISFQFVVFFSVIFLVFLALPSKFRIVHLLIASYAFYATWNAPLILLILFTTSSTYLTAVVILRSKSENARSLGLAAGIFISLACLLYFKYANFFLAGVKSFLPYFNTKYNFPEKLDIILPLGISFYTFESISFLMDVYRGKIKSFDFRTYNFYIMYFPHLLSGPIIRYNDFTLQVANGLSKPRFRYARKGLRLIVLGVLYKIMLADPMAAIADPIFAKPTEFDSFHAWYAALAFTGQIYFDFLGYTHIARGISNLFNIDLPINFNYPYEAKNISDFWRRWHISLSTWIRDYLYLPFGGNRVGTFRTLSNLLVIMTIAGAWHGAGSQYIVWGAYHGLLLVLYQIWKRVAVNYTINDYLSRGATFIAVLIGWVIFRAPNLNTAKILIQKMVHIPDVARTAVGMFAQSERGSLIGFGVIILCCLSGSFISTTYRKYLSDCPSWGKLAIITGLTVLVYIMSADDSRPFIYFQF